jgi:predicted dehydrogenase
VIRLGIVGCNYGRAVQLPAFRADPRCKVVALAGRDTARTAELARATGVAKGMAIGAHWSRIPTCKWLPSLRCPACGAQISDDGAALGKPVFAEKPMASDLARARHAAPIYARPAADHDRF